MRIGTGIAGMTIGLLLCAIPALHGQGFDWRVIYDFMQYGANTDPQEMRISETGMIYSRMTYWDIPPTLDHHRIQHPASRRRVVDRLRSSGTRGCGACTWRV